MLFYYDHHFFSLDYMYEQKRDIFFLSLAYLVQYLISHSIQFLENDLILLLLLVVSYSIVYVPHFLCLFIG
jgi:hypothetical protein